MVALGKLVSIKTGKLDANAAVEGGEHPFFTCARENLQIDDYAFDCDALLIAGNGDLNVKHYVGKFNAYQRTYVVEVVDEKALHMRYLFHFMSKYVERLRELSIGGVIKYIKLGMLTDAPIPLPPLKEQKRIAAILDKADAIRRKRQQAIELADQFLRSVFLDMFGDPVTNPNGFAIEPLSSLCDVRDGTHDSPKYQSIGRPLVTSKNLKNGSINLDDVNLISEMDFIEINKRSRVQKGDILMPMIGTIGGPVLVELDPTFAIKNVALIRAENAQLNFEYLQYLLNGHYFKHITSGNSRGGTQKFLSLGDIRALPIVVPDTSIIKKFLKIMHKIKGQRQQLLGHLERTDLLSASLSSAAFSGLLGL